MTEITFTARQRQIIELIAGGYSNEEIGLLVGISERTVRAHCEAVRHKLGGVPRRRVPLAYRRATGVDPLAWAEGRRREGLPEHRFVI